MPRLGQTHSRSWTTRSGGRPALVALACVLVLAGCGQTGRHPSRQRGTARVRTASTPKRPARAELASAVWHLRVFRFVDRSRAAAYRNGERGPRVLVTYVRFPAGQGPFPLIVFGHGFALLPGSYNRLLDAWAAAGYVVAALVFPVENARAPGGPDESDLGNQPGDVSFVVTELLRADRSPRSPLYGLIDPRRIAVAGHSDGGDTAFAVAYERRYLDWRVRAAIVLSGAVLPPEPVLPRRHSPPLLAVQGSADRINPPYFARALFEEVPAPKYLLSLQGAGHLGPYAGNRRELALVERVTIAFLDHYFRRAPLHSLLAAGRAEPSIARLTADP